MLPIKYGFTKILCVCNQNILRYCLMDLGWQLSFTRGFDT